MAEYFVAFSKPLEGGGRDWGWLMRRRRDGRWQYRHLTEDEWSDHWRDNAWWAVLAQKSFMPLPAALSEVSDPNRSSCGFCSTEVA